MKQKLLRIAVACSMGLGLILAGGSAAQAASPVCSPVMYMSVASTGYVEVMHYARCTSSTTFPIITIESQLWRSTTATTGLKSITYKNRAPGTYPGYGTTLFNPLGSQQFCATTGVFWLSGGTIKEATARSCSYF